VRCFCGVTGIILLVSYKTRYLWSLCQEVFSLESVRIARGGELEVGLSEMCKLRVARTWIEIATD
jgi:hypothetical protein